MPAAKNTMNKTDSDGLKSIELSALAAVRIVKHCHDNTPDPVTGTVLGLDQESTLFATDCFGFLQKLHGEEDDGGEGDKYVEEMQLSLRQVNVDCNVVGFYQSTYMGSFMNETFVDTQFRYQTESAKSVAIVYDPLQVAVGKDAFRAFRLKTNFMVKYAENKRAAVGGPIASVSSSDIFEEIPMKITNPILAEAFLLDQQKAAPNFDSFDLENQSFMEKNITFLLESLDFLGAEQQKMQFYERLAVRQQQQQKAFIEKRRQENQARRERGEDLLAEQEGPAFKRVAMPSQLDTLLISNQIQTYCSQIHHSAGDALGKVFLVGGCN